MKVRWERPSINRPRAWGGEEDAEAGKRGDVEETDDQEKSLWREAGEDNDDDNPGENNKQRENFSGKNKKKNRE